MKTESDEGEDDEENDGDEVELDFNEDADFDDRTFGSRECEWG